MDKIQSLKKLIKEQSRIIEKREKIIVKVGGYDHLNDIINGMIVDVTNELITLEDVNAFFEQDDTKELMK